MIKILLPITWIYDAITRFRNWLFDVGVFPSQEYSVPIICIGNLAVGGTGKTPHTEWLVQHFLHQGKHVAVLSRGYGRKTKGFRWVNWADSAQEVGDEPLQIRRKFHSELLACAVSESRCKGIDQILSNYPQTEIVLLDDAFQHRYVKAGHYILLTDYHRLYSHDDVLPVGRLRENKKGANRADTIIVTKCPPQLSLEEQRQIRASLQINAHQQIFFTSITYADLPSIHKPLLITGIAHPEPLLAHLSQQAIQVKHLSFPDHHNFSLKDKQLIIKFAHQYHTILTTEKDAVRLEALQLPKDIVERIQVIPIVPHFLFGETEQFIKTIENYVR